MLRPFAVLIFLLPLCALAQQPSPSPNYKELYEQANDAAAKWKARADELQKAAEDSLNLVAKTMAYADGEHAKAVALQRQVKSLQGATPAVTAGPAMPEGIDTQGVPTDVVTQIKAKAQQDHPDSYSLQIVRIESELNDYRKLHGH